MKNGLVRLLYFQLKYNSIKWDCSKSLMKASGVFYGKKIKVFSDLGQGIICQSIVLQSIVLNSCGMFMIGSIILFVRIH